MACSQFRPTPGEPSGDHHLLKIKIAETEIIEELEQVPDVQRLVAAIRSQESTHVSNIGRGYLWVIATGEQLDDLRLQGYEIEHVAQGPELEMHKRMVWGPSRVLPDGYHKYDEIVGALEELHRQYPLTTALHIIGRSQEFARPIYALQLADQAASQGNKPRVLFSAAIHGNEIMGTEVTMALMRRLL